MRILLRDLSPGTDYALQLRSNTGSEVSEWSRIFYLTTESDTIAPAKPINVVGSMSGTSFNLSWDAVTLSTDGTAATDLDYYRVFVQSSQGAQTSSYVVKDTKFEFTLEMNRALFASPKANIQMAVSAVDKAGNSSGYTIFVSQTNPAPAAVTGFTGASTVDGFALKWTANTDADLMFYRVYSGTAAGSQTTLAWTGVSTAVNLPSIQYATDMWFKVVAVDVFGTESATAPVVGPLRPTQPFLVDTTAPGVPTGLAATLTNATDGKTAKAAVTWTAVTDTDNDLAEYIIGYKPSSETAWDYTKVDYTNTATTIVGLLPYTNYDFRIRSSDWAANLSNWSATVTKTATGNAAPATVTGVTVTGGKDSLTIKWTPNAEADVANGAGVYLVDVATNTGFTTGLLSYRTGEASLTVTGLAQGTTYYARVKAVDSLGLASAAWSTTASAVTGTLATQFTYTKATTAPSSPNTGDIWFDMTTGFEKQWNGSSWVNTGNASIDYITAKATDLVTNGTGAMGNNYNFSTFDFDAADAPVGATGAFKTKTGGAKVLTIDELIAVDPTKKYRMSFQVKEKGTTTDARLYGYVAPYDSYKNAIIPSHYMFTPGTTTTLATQLNPGDTTITLTSSANWYGSAGKPANTSTNLRSIIWWDYTDPGGKLWPEETYSRNYSGSDYWADGSVVGNVITLRAPYSGPVRPVGTKLSNGSSGGTYMYMRNAANVAATTTWTQWADSITGYHNNPSVSASFSSGWPQGTGYAKVGFLLNRTFLSPYSDPNSLMSVAAVSLSDAAAAQADASAAVKTYINEYAVNASETVAPSSGWSTATPTRTPGTFVWYRTTVTRGDGTSSTTSPALLTGNTGATGSQGIQGPAGADGTSLYTWIKYADTPTTGMADSPTGKTYMGIAYNKTSATESAVYSDYEWSLIKGTDGIQGPPGADGTTTYTWVKYADDVNGAGMSDSPTGKTYIGLAFNKTTATESATATDYQWSLIKGADGAPAAVVSLTATSQVLTSPAGGGATNPATSTVTGTATNTTITAWTYSVDGAAFSATVPAGVSRTGNVITITGSTMTARTIAVRMADANGVADTLTVAKVLDGAAGSTGGTGPAGADGYTVLLTNEAQVFAGSTSAALAGSATTQVVAYKGGTQIAATIGTITGQVTGLTTAITNNGTNNATVTVTVTTALTTQSGTLTIPVTVDGKSFTKTFAWSVSYTGAQGATGNTGATGKGITSVTPYFYQIATGSAAPAKPTASPPPAPWTATEPNYAANTELYRTERIIYTDATFAYTDVSKVSSYTAAVTAIATADGKNKILRSTSAASGTTGYVAGDLWWQIDGSGNVIGQWKYTGSAWVAEAITSSVITNLDVNKLTAGSGFITTLNVGTGGAIQSAGYTDVGTSGFKLSTTGLTIKGTGNSVDVAAVTAGTISAKTWNVGAGGVINVDSTGQIKSNNYSAGSTGYLLSNAGLEINDGSVDAKTLKTGSAIIGDLTIGRSADALGTIKSFDYVAGSAGWKIGKGLFEINQGTVKAAALQIQSGPNLMNPEYASFEFVPSFYTSGKISSATATTSIQTSGAKFGTQFVRFTSTAGASASYLYVGSAVAELNIPVEGSKSYIISAYLKANVAVSNVQIRLRDSAGTFHTSPALSVTTAWNRFSHVVTLPAGVSGGAFSVVFTASTTGDYVDVDGIQVEEKIGSLNTPSVWSPPGITSADGGVLRTGEIRSTSNVTVNGVSQPAWSINLSGNAQFGDALVRGKILVGQNGADADAGQSYIASGNYVADTTGWKIDSAGNAEINNGKVRGDAVVDGTLTAQKIGLGVLRSNLIANPGFEDEYSLGLWDLYGAGGPGNPARWRYMSGTPYRVSADARSGNKSLHLDADGTGTSAPTEASVLSPSFQITSGKKYKITVYACAVVSPAKLALQLFTGSTAHSVEVFNSPSIEGLGDFTAADVPVIAGSAVVPSDYVPYAGEFTADTTEWAALRIMNYLPTSLSGLIIDDVSVVEMGIGGASELTSAGLRLFDNDGDEVGAFVSNRPNYFSVTKDGGAVASIAQDGTAAFSGLIVSSTDMKVAGLDLIGYAARDMEYELTQADDNPSRDYTTQPLGLMERRSAGIIAQCNYASTTFTGTVPNGGQIGMFQLDAKMEAGRTYQFTLSPFFLNAVGAGTVGVIVRYTTNGTTPDLSSSVLYWSYSRAPSAGLCTAQGAPRNIYAAESRGLDLKILVCAYASGTTATFYTGSGEVVTASVSDMGPTVASTGTVRNLTSGTPPASVSTYVKTYQSTGAASYGTNGGSTYGVRSPNTGYIYHGQYSTTQDNQFGKYTFANTALNVAGVTIKKAELYLTLKGAYYNSGLANTYIKSGTGGLTATPLTGGKTVGAWAIGSGKWVDITSIFAKSHTTIQVGQAGSTSLSYYGYFASAAALRVTYTQ